MFACSVYFIITSSFLAIFAYFGLPTQANQIHTVIRIQVIHESRQIRLVEPVLSSCLHALINQPVESCHWGTTYIVAVVFSYISYCLSLSKVSIAMSVSRWLSLRSFCLLLYILNTRVCMWWSMNFPVTSFLWLFVEKQFQLYWD